MFRDMCVCVHVHMVRGKIRCHFFKHLPVFPFLSEKGCLNGLELIKLAMLADQCISTSPDLGLHMYATKPHIFYMISGAPAHVLKFAR